MIRPRISVVIPTRDGARTLAACLESLRAASFPPTEIVVVDDASNDDTGEIARRFDCRVIRADENIGAARAKNRGAQAALGDVLFFTDDDVIVSRDALEQAHHRRAVADAGDTTQCFASHRSVTHQT